MILNMASKLEEYHSGHYQQQQQQLTRQSHGKESIHSGQFMVSTFEAEAQDEDDSEIKMPDPDDPTLEKVDECINQCTDVQLYVPQKVAESGSSMFVASAHLEIETSLTKLFKCMNLAYSQKLTSPKWNHFKGIRLRWKDKIRLNNVIWRCWHMQFILKKRTPVCQFASPLDADIHINPQSVVLEGKYWKRQLSVIKAEYRKWRRNFRSAGNSICDTRSEFDFLDWSPLSNDRIFGLSEDWTTDTLFSAINGPFPFPDPREIARGAGIADFIQPSLGPLQPNLDDLDITFQELLQSARLPPVPEEGAEDILPTFPAIMGSEPMDSPNIIDATNANQARAISETMEDANMIDLNAPINTMPFSNDISMQSSTVIGAQNTANMEILSGAQYTDSIITGNNTANILGQTKSNTTVLDNFTTSNASLQLPDNGSVTVNSITGITGKNILKGRVSKNVSRPFRRREPHNYDKAQPTLHQTTMYQQMLAEQQQQQQQQQQLQSQIVQPIQFSQQFPNSNMLGTGTYSVQTSSVLNVPSTQNPTVKSFSVPQTLTPMSKLGSSQSEILSMLNINNQVEYKPYKSYKPYPSAQSIKKAASTAGYININSRNIRQHSPPSSQQQTTFISEKHASQNLPTKEMYRSNSLPLNSSLPKLEPKDDTFAVPKYNAKSNRSRTRSNSVQQLPPVTQITQIQPATSEPMLTSTLAQLLTTANGNNLSGKTNSPTSAINSNKTSLPPSGFSSNYTGLSNQQQQNISQPLSSVKSTSIPLMIHSPPGNKVLSFPPTQQHSTTVLSISPDSFTDQDSPLSPSRSIGRRDNQRRAGHIHAEQKRRYNIKNGFDMLHQLIPQLQQSPNAKLSKAAMLQKGAEYIRQLRGERKLLNEKMDSLRKERDNLNSSLTHLHSILPANGAPVSRQRSERVKQLYNQYVRYRTMQNWKFWILGLILEPLLSSYTTAVSKASIEELYRTALLWVDQHCSLIELRPAVSNKLRYLSMTTDILSDPPSTLQEEVLKAVNNVNGQHPNLNSS